MTDDIVSINWVHLEEFVELLERMDDYFVTILIEEYTKFGELVEEGAKALAPLDHSALQDSIHFDRAKKTTEGVEVEGGSNLAYALRRHEEPYRMGTYPKYEDGSKFPNYYVDGRGAKTRSKPAWRGQKAGRKYLTRAIEALEDYYLEMLDRIYERALGGDF